MNYLTQDEIAERYGRSTRAVRRWLSDGLLAGDALTDEQGWVPADQAKDLTVRRYRIPHDAVDGFILPKKRNPNPIPPSRKKS